MGRLRLPVPICALVPVLILSRIPGTCFRGEKQPISHKQSAARSDQVSVIGLCADNTKVSGTSLPPLHLSRPTLVSPPRVRQGLSVKQQIKGKSGGAREGRGSLLVYHPSRRVSVTDEGHRRNSLKTKGKGKLTGTLACIALFNPRRQGLS